MNENASWLPAESSTEIANRAAAWFQHHLACEVVVRLGEPPWLGRGGSALKRRAALGHELDMTEQQLWRKLRGEFYFTLPEIVAVIQKFGADVAPPLESKMGP